MPVWGRQFLEETRTLWTGRRRNRHHRSASMSSPATSSHCKDDGTTNERCAADIWRWKINAMMRRSTADRHACMDAASHRLGEPVEQIETHISRIFLAGDRAFKMKRAVHFPYVDFSTPELRLAACLKGGRTQFDDRAGPLSRRASHHARSRRQACLSMATARWWMRRSRWSASTSRSCSTGWRWPEH